MYTGTLKGWQEITDAQDPVLLTKVIVGDILSILDTITKVYDISTLLSFKQTITEHFESLDVNVHDVVIDDLGEQIIDRLYLDWIGLGNSNTKEEFEKVLFQTILLAETDEELLSDSEQYVTSVKNYFRLLRVFHDGVVYSHPPVLNHISSGENIYELPLININSATDDVPALLIYPSDEEIAFKSELMDHMSTFLTTEENTSEVVLFDFLHEIINQSSIADQSDVAQLNIVISELYSRIYNDKPEDKDVAIADFVSAGELIGEIPDDVDLRNIEFDRGSWELDINFEIISEPTYYLQISHTLTTTWNGFSEMPTPAIATAYEPRINIFRYPTDQNNVYVRFSDGNNAMQFTIPISAAYHHISIAYDETSIRYAYEDSSGKHVQTISKIYFPIKGQRVEINDILRIRYYLDVVNDDQLTYLIA